MTGNDFKLLFAVYTTYMDKHTLHSHCIDTLCRKCTAGKVCALRLGSLVDMEDIRLHYTELVSTMPHIALEVLL